MSCLSVTPLGHRLPWLMGWSGSPSTCTTAGRTFLALSPSVWMITPQLTEQYGQVERVSVVREILSSRDCAYAFCRLNPSADATIAPPPAFTNTRRVTFTSHLPIDERSV